MDKNWISLEQHKPEIGQDVSLKLRNGSEIHDTYIPTEASNHFLDDCDGIIPFDTVESWAVPFEYFRFGHVLTTLMDMKNVSVDNLSAGTGIPECKIRNFQNAVQAPRFDEFGAIAHELGLTFLTLFILTNRPNDT